MEDCNYQGEKILNRLYKYLHMSNEVIHTANSSDIKEEKVEKFKSSKKDIIYSKDGIWIKYDQGSEPYELVKSLEGKGTRWCALDIETIRIQLQYGDFYIYYTKDSKGEYKQPRISIRMYGNTIVEVRGISEHQNLESGMEEILDKKLEEFPDSDMYRKKVRNMETLTSIYKEYKNRELTVEELNFLYEIDDEIEGFGYYKDPRIKEIIFFRNFKEDLSKIFNCCEDEITNNVEDIYVGKNIICFYGNLALKFSHDFKNINFKLPKYVIGSLILFNLTNANGLKLSDNINGSLYLGDLTSAKGLKLPNNIGGGLNLKSLSNAENLKLPNNIGGDLYLEGLTSAEGLNLPKNISGGLYLGSLPSTEGLIVPKDFIYGYLIADYITMDDLKAKSLENNEEKSKQKVLSKDCI